MLRAIWLLLLVAILGGVVYKGYHAIERGCVIVFQRTGPLRACYYNEPVIYFSVLGFWIGLFLFVTFLMYRTAKKAVRSRD
ncbi:MAG: hypothetical protein H7A21_14715 [Spirochaetales bacterium]|nr:hypothetical protein [Leptospiraceae bacterium]MCP5482685.1 hypothetical protein [Spirochaetales bacterium]MCP5485067.1 hypothetical protein [Spirochaetales bacterium]